MRQEETDVRRLAWCAVAVTVAFWLTACGRESISGPSIVPETGTVVPETSTPRVVPVPPTARGFYVRGSDLAVEHVPGTAHVAILSWGEDITAIVSRLRAAGQVAFVSTHCCLWTGGRFDPAAWDRVEREWLRPFADAGVLAGVYLAEETTAYGISEAEVSRGAEFVSAHGYPTMVVRGWSERSLGRPPVDYYGVTGYTYSIKQAWYRDWVLGGADVDLAVGQAFDATIGYERGIPDQDFQFETARRAGIPLFAWVWRWPGQTGCADDPECRAAWEAAR